MPVRELTQEEIDEVSDGHAAGIELPDEADTEVREYTMAEIELLAQEEGIVVDDTVLMSDAAFDDVAGTLTKLLRTPQGKPLKVVVEDNNSAKDKVNIYDTRTGQPYAVPKASIRMYLDKLGPNGKVFSPRPVKKAEPKPFPCPAIMCKADGTRKMFSTQNKADEHYRNRHRGEYTRSERQRERDRENREMAMNEGICALLASLKTGNINTSPESIALLREAAEAASLDSVPNKTWRRPRIMAWMEEQRKGWYGGEHEGVPYSSMTVPQLLKALGCWDEEEAVA